MLHWDIYRYKRCRNQLINNFLGDFLVYQNSQRGVEIRRTILNQLNQFLRDHPEQKEIHFVAHSLGSFILWDLLFSDSLSEGDPALVFRRSLDHLEIVSITTLGSPLLFLKQMLDINFSSISLSAKQVNREYKLRWVNIIHSSDMVAYPLESAIKSEIGSEVFFCDQYVWQDANGAERGLRHIGKPELAMVVAAEDAHSSYLQNNIDGAITGQLIAYNLLGKTNKLSERCVNPRLNL